MAPNRTRPNAAAAAVVAGVQARGAVTEDSVGDPYSFGRNVVYLGLAQTEWITLQSDCTGFPAEEGLCIEIDPGPTGAVIDQPDLGTVTIPGRATNSLVCFTFTPYAGWQWANTTATRQLATMGLRPQVRVESPVLEDPSLVDPTTGLPFNGVLLDMTMTTFHASRTIDPGESEYRYDATTRSCTGGLVSYKALKEQFGLSDQVIRDFFSHPITFTFGVKGNVSMVTDASYGVGVRLYGD